MSRRIPERSRRAGPQGLALWLAALLLSLAGTVLAAERRVLVFQASPPLERALRTALMPWGMQVDTAAEPSAIPSSVADASALARELGADALVWAAPERRELWVYDHTTETLSVRTMPRTALNETRAAALALSVKTELRKGALADAAENATEPSAEPPTPPETATAVLGAAPAAVEVAASVPPEIPATLRVLLHAAVRLGATTPSTTEGRYGLEARWAPWARTGIDGSALPTLWLGVRVDLGPAREIDRPWFRGDYFELDSGAGAGLRWRVLDWLELGGHTELTAQWTSVTGTITSDGQPVERRPLGLAAHLRPELELSLGWLGLLLQPGLGIGIVRPSFQADGIQTLEISRVWWQLGAAARVDLD
jgi:hypothetical protein